MRNLKEEGISPHYTIMHDQQRRGVDPLSRSGILVQRMKALPCTSAVKHNSTKGRYQPTVCDNAWSCAANKEKRGINPSSRSRILVTAKHNVKESKLTTAVVMHIPIRERGPATQNAVDRTPGNGCSSNTTTRTETREGSVGRP
jgi:hypothetical protein